MVVWSSFATVAKGFGRIVTSFLEDKIGVASVVGIILRR